MLVQIEEVIRVIRSLMFVTKLSPVGARNSHGHGYQVSLRCSCEEYGRCAKKQEPPVQVSSRHPTELTCLKEILKRLQDRHVECAQALTKKTVPDTSSVPTVSPDAPNVLQAMMQLEQAKTRAKSTNKVSLQSEKEKDTAEKEVEELKRQLYPKRTHTHDDPGEAHEMLVEVDNWDLIVHRRETTRVLSKTVVTWKSGLARINRSLTQARTVSCVKPVLVWLGGLHIGVLGRLAYWCLGETRLW
jgi:hypothetical protein